MRPTSELDWMKGLRAGYKSLGATQKDQYSWLGRTSDSFVFTAEIDHVDPSNNEFDYQGGTFHKEVLPLSVAQGDHGLRVRHAQELLDAIKQAALEDISCRLLLLRGTKYGTTTGGIHAAVDPGLWIVRDHSGSVDTGFKFSLERVERKQPSDTHSEAARCEPNTNH